MLRCENVTKEFGGVRALVGVSLAVEPGEIVGLVGPNGSGKSTLINVLSGRYKATAGQIHFKGKNITDVYPHVITHLGLARTYQIPRPFTSMTVLENVSISCMFGHTPMDAKRAREAGCRWLEFTGLYPLRDTPVGSINLHQRKLLELARALAAKPELLMLDEVLAGLNPTEVDASVKMIRKIYESGVTIVIVEHLMRVVTSLSTRIVVLDQGQLLADGKPAEVMRDPAVIRAYLGKDYA